MSTNELTTDISPEIINSLILTGDMSKLTPAQQTQYYNAVCKSVGINPLTQPFAIIILQGKKTLYATKGCTQQLSDSRKINTEITKTETIEGVYVSSCRAKMPDGRFTDDIGAVSIGGLKGSELANAMMKSITKAKRRAVLALCGLGMPDETEVEDMPNTSVDTGKSRVDHIIDTTMEEVKDAPQEQKEAPKSEVKTKKEKTKTADVVNKTADSTANTLPEGHKEVIGLIEGTPKAAQVPNPFNDNKPGIKHNFQIGSAKYGTFDEKMSKEIMECIDQRIMVKFEFTERKSNDKIFNDIVKFSKAVAGKDIPI